MKYSSLGPKEQSLHCSSRSADSQMPSAHYAGQPIHALLLPPPPVDPTRSRRSSDDLLGAGNSGNANSSSGSNSCTSLYHQLVSKRKLTPEFANAQANASSPEGPAYWQIKRPREETPVFGHDLSSHPPPHPLPPPATAVRVQDRRMAVAVGALGREAPTRPFPYFTGETETTRRFHFNPPPLEPIAAASTAVKKELSRGLLSAAAREARDSAELLAREFKREAVPDELHSAAARRRTSFDRFLAAGRVGSIPDDSRADEPDPFAYYAAYRKMADREGAQSQPQPPQPPMKGQYLAVASGQRIPGEEDGNGNGNGNGNGSSGSSCGSNVVPDLSSFAAERPGVGPRPKHKRTEYSFTLHEYQREFRKYSERDRFHENVDQILRTHKRQGLPLTTDHIKQIAPPPSGVALSRPHHPRRFLLPHHHPSQQQRIRLQDREAALNPLDMRSLARFQTAAQNCAVVGGFRAPPPQLDHPWGKRARPLQRNDENLFQGFGAAGESNAATISLMAMKRIGRGRFGVLECLNNFAHRMRRVERQRSVTSSGRARGSTASGTPARAQTDVRPGKGEAARASRDDEEGDSSIPLDLTKAVSVARDGGGKVKKEEVTEEEEEEEAEENGSRCGSRSETSTTPSAAAAASESDRLPIKKRTAKYRSLNEEDLGAGSSNDVANAETSHNSIIPYVEPHKRNEVCNNHNNNNNSYNNSNNSYNNYNNNNNNINNVSNANQPVPNRAGGTPAGSCDVAMEKRLKSLIETPDEDGNLPLHLAVLKCDLEVTSALVREMTLRNMSLDRYNNSKQTPLHLAIMKQNADLVRILLAGSSSCNIPDVDGNTSLHLAARLENYEIFKSVCLLSRVPVYDSTVNREGLSVADIIRLRSLPKEFLDILASSQLVNCSDTAKLSVFRRLSSSDDLPDRFDLLPKVTSGRRGDSTGATKPSTAAASEAAVAKEAAATFPLTPSKSPPASLSIPSPALNSIPPLLSPCILNSPPLSPSSSSSSSSASSSSSSMTLRQPPSPPALSASHVTSLALPLPLPLTLPLPLPLARSCLSLSSTTPASSTSLSLAAAASYVDKYGGGEYGAPMSLYAAC